MTIDRVIDVFPAEQQDQVRIQLAGTLQGIVTQNLVPTADGLGRVAALEILLPDDAVRNLIRQGKVEQIYSVMQTGTSRGMQTMEQALADLMLRGVITRQAALARASKPEAARRAPPARRHPQHAAPHAAPDSSWRRCRRWSTCTRRSSSRTCFRSDRRRSRAPKRAAREAQADARRDRRPEDRGRQPHRRSCRQQRRQEARPDRACAARARGSSTAARFATRPGSRPR